MNNASNASELCYSLTLFCNVKQSFRIYIRAQVVTILSCLDRNWLFLVASLAVYPVTPNTAPRYVQQMVHDDLSLKIETPSQILHEKFCSRLEI